MTQSFIYLTNNITIYMQKHLQYQLITYQIPTQYRQLHLSLVGVMIITCTIIE